MARTVRFAPCLHRNPCRFCLVGFTCRFSFIRVWRSVAHKKKCGRCPRTFRFIMRYSARTNPKRRQKPQTKMTKKKTKQIPFAVVRLSTAKPAEAHARATALKFCFKPIEPFAPFSKESKKKVANVIKLIKLSRVYERSLTRPPLTTCPI